MGQLRAAFLLLLLRTIAVHGGEEVDTLEMVSDLGNRTMGTFRAILKEMENEQYRPLTVIDEGSLQSCPATIFSNGGTCLSRILDPDSDFRYIFIQEGPNWAVETYELDEESPIKKDILRTLQALSSSSSKIVFLQTPGLPGKATLPEGRNWVTFNHAVAVAVDGYMTALYSRCKPSTVAPVGEAFNLVRKDNNDLFWDLFKNNGNDFSDVGVHLAALVLYATLSPFADMPSCCWEKVGKERHEQLWQYAKQTRRPKRADELDGWWLADKDAERELKVPEMYFIGKTIYTTLSNPTALDGLVGLTYSTRDKIPSEVTVSSELPVVVLDESPHFLTALDSTHMEFFQVGKLIRKCEPPTPPPTTPEPEPTYTSFPLPTVSPGLRGTVVSIQVSHSHKGLKTAALSLLAVAVLAVVSVLSALLLVLRQTPHHPYLSENSDSLL